MLVREIHRIGGVERESLKFQVLSPDLIQKESKGPGSEEKVLRSWAMMLQGVLFHGMVKEGARGQRAEDRQDDREVNASCIDHPGQREKKGPMQGTVTSCYPGKRSQQWKGPGET